MTAVKRSWTRENRVMISVDVPAGTLDDAGAVAPAFQVLWAGGLAGGTAVPDLPEFARYPGP